MQRRRKTGQSGQIASATFFRKKMKPWNRLDLLADAKLVAELQKVCAAPHAYMLAVIDQLARFWIDLGSRTASQRRPGFEKLDFNAARGKSDRCGDAREASPDDSDACTGFHVIWTKRRRGSGERHGGERQKGAKGLLSAVGPSPWTIIVQSVVPLQGEPQRGA